MDDLNTSYDRRKPRVWRRGFLRLATGTISAILGLLLGIPFVVALIAPTYRKSQSPYARVGEVGPLPQEQPVSLRFQFQSTDAFLKETENHEAWVVKHSDSDLTVFSPICTHLGCHYDWVASRQEFVCPCHNSFFSITGKVLAGPSPRSLDTLPYRIESGVLYVKWERYQAGVPEKILV
jgi:menaquinol-cytochrome c reductase iron-sulfur subunit